MANMAAGRRAAKKLHNSPVDDQMRQIMKRGTLRVDEAYRASAQARNERKTPEEREAEHRRYKEDRDEMRVMENQEAERKRFKWLRGITGMKKR